MALTIQQVKQIRTELQTTSNPLFFFDDDPDGLASFLLLYRFVKLGHGIVVKAKPVLEELFLRKVEEYNPDKIFVLDKPDISPEFLKGATAPIVWIDHHEPKQVEGPAYFNPMTSNPRDNRPTSMWCYKAVRQDLWIAMVGIVGDWYLPKFSAKFSAQYPGLLPPSIKTPEQALYETELGKLIRVFSFILKGNTTDVMQCVKILTRIQSPDDILLQQTPQGTLVYKRYQQIMAIYSRLFAKALKAGENDGDSLIFTYTDDQMSFTGDLSNELMYRFPNKTIIVARIKGGEMKCSLRSGRVSVLPVLKNALEGIDGYGGGHEKACGACIKEQDWDRFLANFEQFSK